MRYMFLTSGAETGAAPPQRAVDVDPRSLLPRPFA